MGEVWFRVRVRHFIFSLSLKSKKTEMARLWWISTVAILLFTSPILVTYVEAGAAKSNEEDIVNKSEFGRFPGGSRKDASGCPVPPHSDCPPPPHAQRPRPILHAWSNTIRLVYVFCYWSHREQIASACFGFT